VAPTASYTSFRGWLRVGTTRASALPECGSIKREPRKGVERLGIALEPETDYECGIDGRGAARTLVSRSSNPLQRYLMTLYGAHAARPAHRRGMLDRPLSLEADWGLSHFLRLRAWISATLTIRMPAHSPLPFRISPGNQSWRCFTGRCFLGPLRRRRHVMLPPTRWILIAKASGFHTGPISLRLSNRV